jgi:pimeloyl-ACP methyl ester carboxylesterase
LKHALVGLFLGTVLSLPGGASAHGDSGYRIEQIVADMPSSSLRRTRFTIAEGSETLNRFEVVRVQALGWSSLDNPPLILLSPFGFQTEVWELTNHGYDDSFVARLALAGNDVWLVDNRTAELPPGSCESGAVDCTPLADWGVDTGVDDALYVQKLVKFFHPFQKPVIGGFSGGSSAAMATIDRKPQLFAGLFMWEGTLYTADPAIRARNAAFCAADEAQLAAGVVVDPTVQGFKTIFELAIAAPSAPSPIPAFPPGTTNLQALIFAFSAPNPASPLNFTEGFIRLIGDPFAGSFAYADLDRLLLLGPMIGTYAPVRFLRDSHCAMGGVDNRWSDHLHTFRGDVLVYAEGFGFGQMMVDTANLMTRARVTIDYHAEFGESDRYYSTQWVDNAVQPLLNWLPTVRR